MGTVLIRAMTSTCVVLLLNTMIYIFMGRNMQREAITILSILAMICAVPVILGYILTYLLTSYNNIVLHYVNIILFILNGLLILGAGFGILASAMEMPVLFLGFSYVIIGAYVFWETTKVIGLANQQRKKKGVSQGDLLDDGF